MCAVRGWRKRNFIRPRAYELGGAMTSPASLLHALRRRPSWTFDSLLMTFCSPRASAETSNCDADFDGGPRKETRAFLGRHFLTAWIDFLRFKYNNEKTKREERLNRREGVRDIDDGNAWCKIQMKLTKKKKNNKKYASAGSCFIIIIIIISYFYTPKASAAD